MRVSVYAFVTKKQPASKATNFLRSHTWQDSTNHPTTRLWWYCFFLLLVDTSTKPSAAKGVSLIHHFQSKRLIQAMIDGQMNVANPKVNRNGLADIRLLFRR